jgi:Tol biopolymer transport system component
MHRARFAVAFILGLGLLAQPGALARPAAFQAGETPTIDQLISLKRAGSATISPNGQWVAYTVRDTNWDENNYHTEIWLADAKSGELRQLTSHPKKSSTSPAWSPDSTKLAFATDRDDKRQVYVIDPRGGEARKVTSVEDGVGSFAWAPDGKSIAFASTDPKTEADKEREKKFGDFDVIGEGYRMSHLWVLDLAKDKPRRLTSGAFTVGQFNWSPDGTQIAFDHRVNSANTSGATADISIVAVADGKVRPLVTQPGADSGPVWSPDGSRIAFGSAMMKEFSFLNSAIAVIPAAGGRIENISAAFDEDPSIVRWTPAPRSAPRRSSTASIPPRAP